jgi:hypothetical protein
MKYWQHWAASVSISLVTIGCGGGSDKQAATDAGSASASEQAESETPTKTTAAKSKDATDEPKVALEKFLRAIKAGDDETAAAMLTPLAREKTAEMGLNVAPPGSDTATFEVVDIEMKGTTGAYVACKWNEIDEQGETSTDQVVWVMAKQEDGWRIAGMVAKIFPDLDAIVFNFEDPEDMIRKQEMAMQEMERRAAAAAGVAPTGEGVAADSVGETAPPPAESSAARPPRTRAQ